jgi:phosphate transport system substrate-binding protein
MTGAALVVTALFAMNTPAMSAGQIKIAGDPCTIPLAKKLGEAFTQKTGVEVVAAQGKCRTGVSEVLGGKADIGVSTFNFGDDQLDKSLVDAVVGKAPIILIVNKSNPVNNITNDQLKGILAGNIRNWKELGGKDMEIKNVILAPCVTETMSYQAEHLGHDINKLKPEKPANPVAQTNELIEQDEAAIGPQLFGSQTPGVKVLTIDGVLPDEKTLGTKYAYFENYNMITKGAPTGAVKEYIEFAQSPEGERIQASMKHVPLQSARASAH